MRRSSHFHADIRGRPNTELQAVPMPHVKTSDLATSSIRQRSYDVVTSEVTQAFARLDISTLRDLTTELRSFHTAEAEVDLANANAFINFLECDYFGSIRNCDEAVQGYKSLNNPNGLARALSTMGSSLMYLGRYDDALAALHESLALYANIGDELGHARITASIGQVYMLTSDYDSAVENLLHAQETAQRLDDQSIAGWATWRLGSVRSRLGDTQGAQQLFKQSLTHFVMCGDVVGTAYAHTQIGGCYCTTGDYPRAVEHSLIAMSMYEQHGHERGLGLVSLQLGDVHSRIGNYEQALTNHSRALQIAESMSDKWLIALALHNIGWVQHQMQEYRSCISSFMRAKELFLALNDSTNHSEALDGLGLAYSRLGELDTATQYFREASRYAELGNNQRLLCSVLGHLVENCIENNDLEEAKRLISRMTVIGEEYQDLLPSVLIYKARLEQACGEIMSSYQILQKALDIHEPYDDRVTTYEIHSMIRDLAYQLRDIDLYVRHDAERQRLSEDIRGSKVSQRVAVMEAEMKVNTERSRRELETQRRQHLEDQLALTTTHLSSQVELVSSLRRDLQSLIQRSTDPYKTLADVSNRLRDLPCEEIDWVRFERDFVALHPHFTEELVQRFPNLTKQEVKMCQLTRIGLTSHEIAKILCLSERSVESHRYNIRKKLGLQTKDKLSETLQIIQ